MTAWKACAPSSKSANRISPKTERCALRAGLGAAPGADRADILGCRAAAAADQPCTRLIPGAGHDGERRRGLRPTPALGERLVTLPGIRIGQERFVRGLAHAQQQFADVFGRSAIHPDGGHLRVRLQPGGATCDRIALAVVRAVPARKADPRSEEHTSEL